MTRALLGVRAYSYKVLEKGSKEQHLREVTPLVFISQSYHVTLEDRKRVIDLGKRGVDESM